MEEMRSSADWV